jgi:hypothetical protein
MEALQRVVVADGDAKEHKPRLDGLHHRLRVQRRKKRADAGREKLSDRIRAHDLS